MPIALPIAPMKGCTTACTIGRRTIVWNADLIALTKLSMKLRPPSKPRMIASVSDRSMSCVMRFHSASISRVFSIDARTASWSMMALRIASAYSS